MKEDKPSSYKGFAVPSVFPIPSQACQLPPPYHSTLLYKERNVPSKTIGKIGNLKLLKL